MVLRALCAEYERLDSVFCNYKQSVYTQVVCDGRREADPMFSAGQFLSARPEEDSPHWRLNACIIAAVNFGFRFSDFCLVLPQCLLLFVASVFPLF